MANNPTAFCPNADPVRVLVVDDEDTIQNLVVRLLKPEGYDINRASDGIKALQLLAEKTYDIIITDIIMPGMSGTELIKRIHEFYQADVIAMTGQADLNNYEMFIGLGACDFIQKPFSPDELLLRVKRVLRERQLKEEVAKAHQELSHSQKLEAIGQLSSGIAHEINTPLQYISDNTRFIKDAMKDIRPILAGLKKLTNPADGDSVRHVFPDEMQTLVNSADLEYVIEEMPGAIDQTLEGIQAISRIVKAMKAFSHPGTEEHVPTDLNQSIRNALTISKNEWKYVADMVQDLDETLPDVTCNPGEMNQVLLNLIVNAGHAIADRIAAGSIQKGTIRISSRKVDDWFEIAVRDTGTGIPENIRPLIFNPFFTTKAVGKGTGQGLAIARSIIVDRHKGEIDLETRPDEGTTFFIRLPLTRTGHNGNSKPETFWRKNV